MKKKEVTVKVSHLVKEYKVYQGQKDRLLEVIIPKYQKHTMFTAVNDVSFEVEKGDVIGFLGRNGAGKSTILKMLTGVVTPTSGEIKIKGKVSSLLELGTSFNPELTGVENIYQHGIVNGFSKEEMDTKFNDIVDFADIGEHIDQPVKSYSSGMFARLAFACAINIEPEVLIVDEVLSVGDISFQMKCFKKFEDFKKRGKTIIFVSHSLNDILLNCNKALILERGRILEIGDAKEIVDEYKKLMTGNYLDKKEKLLEMEKEKEEKKEYRNEIKNKYKNTNKATKFWKEQQVLNEKAQEYGSKDIEIVDFCITDMEDNIIRSFDVTSKVKIKVKYKFNKDIQEPIFAISIKNVKGLELCGLNTHIEKYKHPRYKKGEEYVFEFIQKIPLAPATYALSLGCTKYKNNGELEVYHRLYDVLFFDIISDKEACGMCCLEPEIYLAKCGKGETDGSKSKI